MSEQNTFHFELVSPEEKLISAPARMVVIPGEEGDIGVLADHSALLSSLRPGVIELFAVDNDNDNDPVRIFVAGGFADISGDHCTVLAEEAVNVKDLDEADLEQTIRNLTEDIGLAEEDADKARIARRLAVTQARLAALTGRLVV